LLNLAYCTIPKALTVARGFYRKHDLIVLDEPTAAIDPLEETRIYQKFIEAVKGKTAIIVTHRLGSARIASNIIVMNYGQIIEMGSHDDLILKKGVYYNMFRDQAKWYERDRAAAYGGEVQDLDS
jgi:ATP-binding cassette subfamily B protein